MYCMTKIKIGMTYGKGNELNVPCEGMKCSMMVERNA